MDDRKGLFEEADGGTLLRDEIGDMALALQAALEHDWPGNVREIRNVIERLVTLSTSAVVSVSQFRSILALGHLKIPDRLPASGDHTLLGVEREAILRTLRSTNGNQSQAAKILGMGRSTLWRKMKAHGIESGPQTREVREAAPTN